MLKRVRRNRSISLNQNGLTASISVSPFGSVYPLIKLCRNKNSIKIILIFMSIIQIEQCFKFENRCDLRVCFG